MKKYSKQNSAPALVTYLELNKKYGHGYQARLIMNGVIDSVIDAEPFTLEEAYSGAVYAIEEINKETGYGYDPYSVIRITDEAVKVNRKRDFTSARVARDIETGRGELATPTGTDYTTKMIDGKEEILLSGRGTVLMVYFSWCDDKMPKAREALKRYCQYLAMQGYGSAAPDIFKEIERKGRESGANWIKSTYGKYIKDNAAVINYMLN